MHVQPGHSNTLPIDSHCAYSTCPQLQTVGRAAPRQTRTHTQRTLQTVTPKTENSPVENRLRNATLHLPASPTGPQVQCNGAAQEPRNKVLHDDAISVPNAKPTRWRSNNPDFKTYRQEEAVTKSHPTNGDAKGTELQRQPGAKPQKTTDQMAPRCKPYHALRL